MDLSKTLITGGHGLIGTTIEGGIHIGSVDADLTDINETHRILAHFKPEYIIHLAAVVGGIIGNIENKGRFFYDNAMINMNIIESAKQHGVKKVLCGSSTCVFPEHKYPIKEEYLFDGLPNPGHVGYAWSKRLINIMNNAYDSDNTSVFFTNVYGPRDSYDLINGHVTPSLIHKCFLAKKHNTDFVVWGSGKPMREIIYSKDVGKILPILLENAPEDIIISSGHEYSIEELASEIAKAFGFKGRIVFDDSKPDGQFKKPCDITRLKKYIGDDFEFTSLQDGLAETIEWFNRTYPNIRGV